MGTANRLSPTGSKGQRIRCPLVVDDVQLLNQNE